MTKIDEIMNGLIAIGVGEVRHVGMGLCPDFVEGHDVRDPDCKACQILIAAATTIDEIMVQANRYALRNAQYCAAHITNRDLVSGEAAALRSIITQAIAEARADGFRDGAKAMREELATACGSTFTTISGRDEVERLHFDDERMSATEIRDWPLCATVKREPVRLTDAEMRQLAEATLYSGGIYDRVRAIETAVLTANRLKK